MVLKTELCRFCGAKIYPADENWKSFKITYQDIEGDWLLAEDVPWRKLSDFSINKIKSTDGDWKVQYGDDTKSLFMI
ncbi:hypothetical protein REPUB_Repub01dG0140000 [Reevesia pubescens]